MPVIYDLHYKNQFGISSSLSVNFIDMNKRRGISIFIEGMKPKTQTLDCFSLWSLEVDTQGT